MIVDLELHSMADLCPVGLVVDVDSEAKIVVPKRIGMCQACGLHHAIDREQLLARCDLLFLLLPIKRPALVAFKSMGWE